MSGGVGPAVHVAIATLQGTAALRDLVTEDIEHIVAYLHDERDEHLNSLIDRKRLGPPEETHRRFLSAIRTGHADQRHVAFAITLGGQLAGFTHLSRRAPHDNYSHWHVTDPRLRAGGLSSALYPYRIKLYFDLYAIDRLIHQTKTRNIGVNRMLDKYVAVAETRYIERPDGAASADEFHLRYVLRSDIPRLFATARNIPRDRSGDGA